MKESLTHTAEDQCWADPHKLRPIYIRRTTHAAVDITEQTHIVRIETPDEITEVHSRPVFTARRVALPDGLIANT